MNRITKNETGFSGVEIFLVAVIIGLIGTLGWLVYRDHQPTIGSKASQQSSSPAIVLTNDQIYQQVASQLKLSRRSVVFFRIYGQNKVQYATDTSGNTYAYKVGGTWKIAETGAQSLAVCDTLKGVPGQFRPPCSLTDSTSNNIILYSNSHSESTNYPPSQAISYIGQ